MKSPRPQRRTWQRPLSRAEMDQRRPDVGDHVWCAGRPFIISHVNADGSLGLEYDAPAKRPQPKVDAL